MRVLTRLTGLRSFLKMSSFDFAITVAIGSVVASTLLAEDPSLLAGAFGLTVLYGMQWSVSKCRRETSSVERMVGNERLCLSWPVKRCCRSIWTPRVGRSPIKVGSEWHRSSLTGACCSVRDDGRGLITGISRSVCGPSTTYGGDEHLRTWYVDFPS